MTRKLLIGLGLLLLAMPASAAATQAGANGRIVMTSARDANGNGNLARLYILSTPPGIIGPLIPLSNEPAQGHRHATWSPDRTMIAYARGNGGNFDLFIQDMTKPGSAPVQITNSSEVTDDRPSWSPDGTRIAWESEFVNNSNQRDILVDTAPFTPGGAVNFTNTTTAGQFEGKPVWSPDSSTLFYEKGNAQGNTDVDIFKKSIGGGAETPVVNDPVSSAIQPSLSPDGKQICFASGLAGDNDSLNVFVATTANTADAFPVSKDPNLADYNCTWSPDGKFIAYVTGAFAEGRLVRVSAKNSPDPPILLTDSVGFDGNPDWAPDGRPLCPDLAVTTTVNTPVTIPSANCTDTGPAYEHTPVRAFPETQPANGTATLENGLAGDPIIYTPNQGAIGTDSFQVRSQDGFGFGFDEGTITVTIKLPPKDPEKEPPKDPIGDPPKPRCGGKVATIVGRARGEVIVGTSRNDVIAALGGNDQVRGGAGNDIICGGAGNDRLSGQGGNDTLVGEGGKDSLLGGGGVDKLNGGPGNDPCIGGGGRDKASSCQTSVSIP